MQNYEIIISEDDPAGINCFNQAYNGLMGSVSALAIILLSILMV